MALIIKTYSIIVSVVLILFCTGFAWTEAQAPGAMVVSVSSDGHYVISSHQNSKAIVLWDITDKSVKTISRNGNIYSAYFIRHTPYFLWQDLNNIVHLQDVSGKEIKTFLHTPTYGEVATPDLTYFASDINWSIIKGIGDGQKIIKTFCPDNDQDFVGFQKLLNLTLADNNKLLVSSGVGDLNNNAVITREKPNTRAVLAKIDCNFNNVVLWLVATGKPLFIFPNNRAKTVATISPDNKFVVTGDETGNVYIWQVKSGKLWLQLDNPIFGRLVKSVNCPEHNVIECSYFDKDETPSAPWLFSHEGNGIGVYTIKFVDMQGDFLVFYAFKHYAVLFNVNNRRPLKYFNLGNSPEPVSDGGYYARNAAIDSAPAANIVVVSQRLYSGVMVYKFDPTNLTLTKVWSPLGF